MLVASRFIPRRALPSHTSQLRLSYNPSVRSLLTALMVQTRRATQLAAKDEPKHMPTAVKPTRQPLKRARREHQPEERVPSAVATGSKEPERESQWTQVALVFRADMQ